MVTENWQEHMEFSEVFPTLILDKQLMLLVCSTRILKVTSSSDKKRISVYLLSDHIIQKASIYELENSIKKQLFKNMGITIRIVELFYLSDAYTTNHLLKEYYPSIELEMNHEDRITGTVFSSVQINSNEDQLELVFPNNEIAKSKKFLIHNKINEIFNERFSRDIKVVSTFSEEVSFTPAEHKNNTDDHNSSKTQESNVTQNTNSQNINDATSLNNLTDTKTSTKTEKQSSDFTTTSSQNNKSTKQNKSYKTNKKHPDLILGRGFDDESIPIEEIHDVMGEVVVKGQIIAFDTRVIRNEKTLIFFVITDFTDSIVVKMFVKNDVLPELLDNLILGNFYKVKGMTTIDKFDHQLTISNVTGILKTTDARLKREDRSDIKRVELHSHTKMSDMDGVIEVRDLIRRAHAFGHKAIAITDHGVVQAFPGANKIYYELDKNDPFKVIYGLEGYMVDDTVEVVDGDLDYSLEDTFVVVSIITTGSNIYRDTILRISAVKIKEGKIIEEFDTYINPKKPISFEITVSYNISDDVVKNAATIQDVLPEFLEFVGSNVFVGYNVGLTKRFLEQTCRYQDIYRDFVFIDLIHLAQILLPTITKYSMANIAKALSLSNQESTDSNLVCKQVTTCFFAFRTMLLDLKIHTLKELNQFGNTKKETIRKKKTNHVIILAQNDIGKLNLYRLVSLSHIEYFSRRPRIPKSILQKYREGLIIKR